MTWELPVIRLVDTFQVRFLALVFSLVVLQIPQQSQADDLDDTALSIAPQDVAFFSTGLNMQESWESFMNGKFVARLRAVSYVRSLEAEFETQWAEPEGQLAQAKMYLENPNVRNLLKLGKEMLSDEMFVYGNDQWCDTIVGIMNLQNDIVDRMSQGPAAAQAYLMELNKEDLDSVRIPETVLGFRIDDVENATLQLDALEGILRLVGSQMEPAKVFLERLRRTDLQDGQTLSITVDPSMIPMDSVQGPEADILRKIISLIEDRQFTFALGVKAKMLLIAFGESGTPINTVGDEGSKLIDHPVMDVLRESNTENLRGIGFASAKWMESQWKANFGNYFQNIASQFTIALDSEADKVEDIEQWKADIQRDAAWMDDRINELVPEFGPVLSWSHAVEGGSEGFSYSWSKNLIWENGRPLSVADHAGRNPLMMVAFKQQDIAIFSEICDYVLDNGLDHLTRFVALAEEDPAERETAVKAVEKAWPLIKEAHTIMQDKVGPSLSSNESLVSIAANWTLNSLPEMPMPPSPLPLPELGLACKVDDRDLFREGFEEMYDLFDQFVELVREFEPEAAPADYTVPRPEESQLGDATKFSYSEWTSAVPIDGFEPQLVLGDDFLVLGYSNRQIEDMLQKRELETRPTWLKPESPVAAVSYFDFSGFITAIHPWIEYGLTLNYPSLDDPVAAAPGPVPTGNDILQIWDCFTAAGKAAGTTTVSEDGPIVSRWIWIGE